MNKKNFLQYLKTISLTILIALSVIIMLLGVIQYQVAQEQIKKQTQDEEIDYSLIGMLIEKNKYLEIQNPDNYKINFKIATLYEIKKDYNNAEIEYKKSINKAPYGEYKPSYNLALLYILINKLDKAQQLMDNFNERPDKKLIQYKTDIYDKLGDKYFNNSEFSDAVEKYQKALSYSKIIKSKNEQIIKEKLVSSYVYLADEKVGQMEIEEAIDYLEMADSILEAPIIEYKLALLLTKDYPDLASRYYDKVFKAAPEIINYDEYYNFLNKLAQDSLTEGNYAQAELYKYKIKELKEYQNTNVISVEDIFLDYAKGDISLNNWSQKYKINFQCKFKNISKHNIDSLNLQVVFKTKDKIIYVHSQQIFDEKSILKAGAQSPIINIRTSTHKTNEYQLPKDITAQIYVSKSKDSYRILLQEIKITEKEPKKITIRLFHQTFALPQFLF